MLVLAGLFTGAVNIGGDELLVSLIQMQNLVYLNTFNLTYPSNIQSFSTNVFNFITFDIVYAYLSPKMLNYFNSTQDIVNNKNFLTIGLSSNFLILNMSTQFLLLFFLQPV
jgi:hypothetical protein